MNGVVVLRCLSMQHDMTGEQSSLGSPPPPLSYAIRPRARVSGLMPEPLRLPQSP